MGVVRILLIMLAGSQLFGCVLVDWIPIRFEPPPNDTMTESVAREKTIPPPSEFPKRILRKSPSPQMAPKEVKPSAKSRNVSRREAPPPSEREIRIDGSRRMAEDGSPEAQYSLGRLYLSGEEGETDYARARELFLAAAKQGHAEALRSLGYMSENGLGMPPSPVEATKWYGLAAGHGDVRAMTAFGCLIFTGTGTQRNTESGLLWLRMAGEQGDGVAQLLLGAIYDTGWGVPEDDAQALKWYALASEGGDPLARFLEACMYALGESVPLDLVHAAEDYRLAEVSGLAEAQAVLENRHINLSGDDGGLRWKQNLLEERPRYAGDHPERFSRMVETFKGAALGDAEAMFGVGSLYWRGDGFEKDSDRAMRWWQLAARLGHKKAKDFLNRIGAFEKNGASGEATQTRVGQKEFPSTLVYRIGFELLDGGKSSRKIHPSPTWMNMLRRSRQSQFPALSEDR